MTPAVQSPVQPPVQPRARTFYSRSSHLNFYASRPRRIESDGQKQIEDGPKVEFFPIGDGWGHFTTDDPALIAACEARPDVVGPDVYNRESTPMDMRVRKAESTVETLQREIEEKNRLIASLQNKK